MKSVVWWLYHVSSKRDAMKSQHVCSRTTARTYHFRVNARSYTGNSVRDWCKPRAHEAVASEGGGGAAAAAAAAAAATGVGSRDSFGELVEVAKALWEVDEYLIPAIRKLEILADSLGMCIMPDPSQEVKSSHGKKKFLPVTTNK